MLLFLQNCSSFFYFLFFRKLYLGTFYILKLMSVTNLKFMTDGMHQRDRKLTVFCRCSLLNLDFFNKLFCASKKKNKYSCITYNPIIESRLTLFLPVSNNAFNKISMYNYFICIFRLKHSEDIFNTLKTCFLCIY